MDSLRNLPVILRYEEDGTVVARCPLLPECQCRAASRNQALRTMETLIKHALPTSAETLKSQTYEVVYLAVAPASDSVNRFSKRLLGHPKAGSRLIGAS